MSIVIWVVGGLLGAATTVIVAWVGACWWFGDRDLFKQQNPTHRAGGEPATEEPWSVTPALVIPPNLFPRGHQHHDSGDGRDSDPRRGAAPSPVKDSETTGLHHVARGRGEGHPSGDGTRPTDIIEPARQQGVDLAGLSGGVDAVPGKLQAGDFQELPSPTPLGGGMSRAGAD